MSADNEKSDLNKAHIEKAIRLFTYLGQTQQLKARAVRTLDSYENVQWLGELPDHVAIDSSHRLGEPEPGQPILTIDRVPRIDPPAVADALIQWLAGEFDKPDSRPTLRESIFVTSDEDEESTNEEAGSPSEPIELEDAIGIQRLFDDWIASWDQWAARERKDRVVREIYGDLFSTQLKATNRAEELELVLGIGCLSWRPEGHDYVRRHLLVSPILVQFDDDTGRLTVDVDPASDPLTLELDMLDPGLITSPEKMNLLKAQAPEYEEHVLHKAHIGTLCRRVVHRLDSDAEYDEESADAPTSMNPKAAFAPAILLRKRSQLGMVEIYETIVRQLEGVDEVPSGILPLIEPDYRPPTESDPSPGAVVEVGNEMFLPLPVNEVQLNIIKRVDQYAQTLVQGPPGTGKTHTAAALVSHLLAQGKRVLITAQTDRALKEVREKIPAAIRPLAVSIVGQSRSEMSELKVAVERISSTASNHDDNDAQHRIDEHLENIDRLRRERAESYSKLIEARGNEVAPHSHDRYEGTLAGIALKYHDEAPQLDWIAEFAVGSASAESALSDLEICRWHGHLLDEELIQDEAEAKGRLVESDALIGREAFASMVDVERAAFKESTRHRDLESHEAYGDVSRLGDEVRHELQIRVRSLAEQAHLLESRNESWMNDALTDIRTGRGSAWVTRAAEVARLASQVDPLIEQLGPTTEVTIACGEQGVHLAIAKSLLVHLDDGGKIKTLPDGTPRFGPLTPKAVKLAKPLFTSVRVDELPPTSREQLNSLCLWVEVRRLIGALDKTWPANVPIPEEDTFREQLQWHLTECEQLQKVLTLGERLEIEREWFATNDIPVPNWNDLGDIRSYANLVEAATAKDALELAASPLNDLSVLLGSAARWSEAPQCIADLHGAVKTRNVDHYALAYRRLARLHEVKELIADRDELRAKLTTHAPRLASAIADSTESEHWTPRLSNFNAAWRWDSIGHWILSQDSTDINVLQQQIGIFESRIRNEVELLAAERAWRHAVSPDRITGRARADLTQYAQRVQRLGKGTGKYAVVQRAEIRKAMERCRPAVPVWIMPTYRIAEQLRVTPDMFDVVIVDEASQAGLEATFLQYLAPKMVVIGDDKQVSPSAVGVNQQQLMDLANQYLAGDSYKASWQDPKRSLFDEAKMRFGGLLTLTEHRRCVPEIIGFSNRIAYEPDGIRLIPVRQYGADRLEPIKPVHITNGYEGDNKTNPAEADAIVDQIDKCFSDPRYDGMTFGVISLLGATQAKLIESKLMERFAPEEWVARDLRCGDASDFQGSERNIMFLSMVKAPSEGQRLVALTQEMYVQRFNVATSRAKDQLWVYHSVARSDLNNPEDMRFQLLDYCYGVVERLSSTEEGVIANAVSETLRTEPFDSLFEQRVYNRLIDRGYTVIPQYPASGYKIDLVVIGSKGRLAIECDGDAWHGPEAYERDLGRQRDLERCGWQFFRIRESVFYIDKAKALTRLWETLDELGIHSSDWVTEDLSEDSPEEDLGFDDEVVSAERIHDESSLLASAIPNEPTSETSSMQSELLASMEDEIAAANMNFKPRHAARIAAEPEERDVIETADDHFLTVTVAGAAPSSSQEMSADDIASDDNDSELAPYEEYRGSLPPALDISRLQLIDGLLAIVASEGPVLGHRLHISYVKASGGHRVGKEIARALNGAITAAERKGLVVADNPLGESGVKPRTYRLLSQPMTRPRRLGPRSLDQVPPRELAHHLVAAQKRTGTASEEALFRSVLESLGLVRLTENTEKLLRHTLAISGDPDEFNEPGTPSS